MNRAQTIARLAYAVAQSDGGVSAAEVATFERYLQEHPDRFSEEQRLDILAYFDDFQFNRAHYRQLPPVLADWRLKTLPNTLLVDDASWVLELLLAIAEADRKVTGEEHELIAQVREALSPAHAA